MTFWPAFSFSQSSFHFTPLFYYCLFSMYWFIVPNDMLNETALLLVSIQFGKNFVMSLGMLFIDTNMYNNLDGSSRFAVKHKLASPTDFLPKEHFSWSQEKEKGSNIWHRRGDDEIRELLNLYNNGCCLKSAVLHRDSNRYSIVSLAYYSYWHAHYNSQTLKQ